MASDIIPEPSLEEFSTSLNRIKNPKKLEIVKRFSIKSPSSINHKRSSSVNKRSSIMTSNVFEKSKIGLQKQNSVSGEKKKWKTREEDSESPKKSGFFSHIKPSRKRRESKFEAKRKVSKSGTYEI